MQKLTTLLMHYHCLNFNNLIVLVDLENMKFQSRFVEIVLIQKYVLEMQHVQVAIVALYAASAKPLSTNTKQDACRVPKAFGRH